jgi:hypothetical protein
MMTPEEEAKELVEIFWTEVEDNDYISRKMSYKQAKQCALIAVDEIINVLNGYWNQDCKINNTKIGYYEEVKQEIEKL